MKYTLNHTLHNIKTLLIANRGEIACRIIRTAHELGLKTVAVFTEADAGAAHVTLADYSVKLSDQTSDSNPADTISGYLDIDAIIKAAKATGADAIHPGYGFLSENALFAKAVSDAALRFVGPTAKQIEQLGDKVAAKAFAESLGVNTLPALTIDPSQSTADQSLPESGWPWLIKAAAGGGGRGMRVVNNPTELTQVLGQAQAEARQHFGNPTVFLERYLPKVRHIEVQIFADHSGQVHHLWHRDCTAQRRHQKVIEEAPAANLPEKTSTEILAASCSLAKAAKYSGAGTVEFLVDPDGNWYFLEMNTRLQVEHPATEAITQEDLVAWQLLVADGQDLPPRGHSHPMGHAIELRICAENPAQQFLPTTGTITHLRWPRGQGIRVDHALYEGLTITPNFDSLLAKLIVWGPTRQEAITRLQKAVAETFIEGITTNLSFHRHFLQTRAFQDMDFHTTTLATLSLPAENTLSQVALNQFLIAATAITSSTGNQLKEPADRGDNPWSNLKGWRPQGERESTALWFLPTLSLDTPTNGQSTSVLYQVTLQLKQQAAQAASSGTSPTDSSTLTAQITTRSRDTLLTTQTEPTTQIQFSFRSSQANTFDCFFLSNNVREKVVFQWAEDSDGLSLQTQTHRITLNTWHSGLYETETTEGDLGALSATVPGVVKQIHVEPGEKVTANTVLLIIESMKIEQEITAKHAGMVEAIFVTAGDRVESNQPLLQLTTPSDNDE